MLQNPYHPSGMQWSENHLVQGRVSQEDFAFLKSKFPFNTGMVDKIVAISFKKIIDELRKIDSEIQFATALYVDDPSYAILDDVVARLTIVERRTDRSVVGDDGRAFTEYVSGTTGSLRAEVQSDAEQRTDTEGSTPTRKRRRQSTKKKGVERG